MAFLLMLFCVFNPHEQSWGNSCPAVAAAGMGAGGWVDHFRMKISS
jgi:hypothetical protein